MSARVTSNLLDKSHGCIKVPLFNVLMQTISIESRLLFLLLFITHCIPCMLKNGLVDVLPEWQTSHDVDPSSTMSALACWQSSQPYPCYTPAIQPLDLTYKSGKTKTWKRELCVCVCVCVWQTHQANHCTMVDLSVVVSLWWYEFWRQNNFTRSSHHHFKSIWLRGVPGIPFFLKILAPQHRRQTYVHFKLIANADVCINGSKAYRIGKLFVGGNVYCTLSSRTPKYHLTSVSPQFEVWRNGDHL